MRWAFLLSEEIEEFFVCHSGLPDDRAEERSVELLRVHGDGYTKGGVVAVSELMMTAANVVYKKTCSLKSPDNLAGFESGQAWGHAG